ncbi:hypothetical protein ACOME3_007622 [Neoechinorhynchus agilis]
MHNIVANNAKRQDNKLDHLSAIEKRSNDQYGKGVWEYLNEYRSNPSLMSNYYNNPHESLNVIQMMADTFREYFNDPIADPMLVRKMILERRLNPSVLRDLSMKDLLEQLSNKPVFNRLFFGAPDLLAYVASAVALKLPDERIDIINSSISCESQDERPLLQGKGSLPWNLQLKDLMSDIFSGDKHSQSFYYDRTNECIIDCAKESTDQAESSYYGTGQSTVEQTFSYRGISDQQVAFLNTAIDHPVILRIMLTDQQFLHTILEQALLSEILDSIPTEKRQRIHVEIINEMIRNPIVAKAVAHDPGSFLEAVNRLVSLRSSPGSAIRK